MSLFAVSNIEPHMLETSDSSQDPLNVLISLETQAAKEYDNFIAVQEHVSRTEYIEDFINSRL